MVYLYETMDKDVLRIRDRIVNDPIYFFEKVLGLKRHPIIKKYRGTHWSKWTADMFGLCKKEVHRGIYGDEDYNKWIFPTYRDNEMVTWQQLQVLEAIKEQCAKEKEPKIKISIASGRGVGKSFLLGGLILWSILRKENTQGAVTAPTSRQLNDVLWARLGEVIQRAKLYGGDLGKFFVRELDKTTEKVQMKKYEDTWFISAKVGKKENPEALAGVHSRNFVLIASDEASGVPDEIFKTAEKGLTDPSYLMILISNYRKLNGFFHDSFKRNSEYWTNFTFNGEESPITNAVQDIQTLKQEGRDSDTYRIEVLGLPPKEGVADDDGWVNLFKEDDILNAITKFEAKPHTIGVDPSGAGYDETAHVGRDNFILQILRTAKTDTPKTIANAITAEQTQYGVEWENFIIDNIGEGADVSAEVLKAVHDAECTTVNWGKDRLYDKSKYLNVRARVFHEMQKWVKAGGKLHGTFNDWMELLDIKYTMDKGVFQIMGKEEMRRRGIKSPNKADAAALTFYRPDYVKIEDEQDKRNLSSKPTEFFKV